MPEKKVAVRKAGAPHKKKNKKKNKTQKIIRGFLIAICIILAVALVAAGIIYFVFMHYYGMSDYVPDDKATTMDTAAAESLIDQLESENDEGYRVVIDVTNEAGEVVGTEEIIKDWGELTPEEKATIESSIEVEKSQAAVAQSQALSIDVLTSKDVYNLLLIGVDTRAGKNWNGNSDSMILVSINSTTRQITMTSFMRDTFVAIPGKKSTKLNYAHAVGGGPLLCQTIEQNFRIGVDAYARVDFYGMIDIIDAVGGVDLTVSADEARVANNYLKEICRGNGTNPDDYNIIPGENIHLNGTQAVAYCRIRYVGSDYARTQRQRTVLTLMFNKLQHMDAAGIDKFLNTALPRVTHNIPADALAALITNVPSYLTYSLAQQRVPFDGHFTSVNQDLVPDYLYTIQVLQLTLYGRTNF